MSDPTEYGNPRIVPVDDHTLPPEVEEALALIDKYAEANPAEEEVDVYNATDALRAHLTALRAERDRYRAMAEWLADNCETYDRTGQGWLTEDWLKAAEEATR